MTTSQAALIVFNRLSTMILLLSRSPTMHCAIHNSLFAGLPDQVSRTYAFGLAEIFRGLLFG